MDVDAATLFQQWKMGIVPSLDGLPKTELFFLMILVEGV